MIVRFIPSRRKTILFKRLNMEDIFPATPSFQDEITLLSDDDVQKIVRLNAKLFEAERAILENNKKLKAELDTKKTNGEIYDYMLKTEITYYSSVLGDVFYEGDMAVRLFDDKEIDDWNDMGHIEHPFFTMKHCWLFHSLYDHLHLSFRAISLIDSAIWETTVIEEHAVRFDK